MFDFFTQASRRPPRIPWRALATTASCLFATGVALAQAVVTPPPLPPGSNLARIEPGLSVVEQKRHIRAHHHKFQYRKDYTLDDSIFGEPGAPAGSRANVPQTPAPANPSVSPFGATPRSTP
jgi:hypothetical protein